jgi:import inner membrane translocase subunit TIM16
MKQPAQPARPSGPKRKAPTHSHYLQSKVYRALERIKAERGEATGMETKDAQDPAVNAAEALGAAAAKVKESADAQR